MTESAAMREFAGLPEVTGLVRVAGEHALVELRAQQADETTDGRQRDGFDQELHQDLAANGADGEPNADLAGTLRNGVRHDAENPDRGEHQRNREVDGRAQQSRTAVLLPPLGGLGHGARVASAAWRRR